MNTKNMAVKFIVPCMTVLALAMSQAWAEETMALTVTGELTPKLYYFNYFDGPGSGLTQYTERYNAQEAWTGDRDSGFYADLDLNLTVSNQDRDILTLERQGFGLNNHRGKAQLNGDNFRVTGYYSHFRSASGGIDYLYNPGRVQGGTDPSYNVPANTNTGFVAQFNDDSGGQTEYKIDRTTYGVGMKFKPGMLGEGASLSLNYDGYTRDGNRFSTYVAGGSDVTGGSARVLQRWRGFDQDIDENMHKFSINLTTSPGGFFQLSYDGAIETFDNRVRDYLMGDFSANFGGFFNAASANKDLNFVPDSTLMTHAIRLSKTFGATAVAVGYGMSKLEQDSFTIRQTLAGYDTGEISTDNAFLNINHRISPAMGLEGYIKYANRENDSTFPAGSLTSTTATEKLDVRINSIESWSYGLSATFGALPLKSNLTGGWKREDIDRDLTWTDVSLAGVTGIAPQRTLYREETVSDEIYLKWVARPMAGMTVRVTPSYLWADKTGLVTEPEESLNLKTAVSYAVAEGMQINAYYNYKHKQNNNNAFTNALANDGLGTSQAQDIDDTFHSAGASINLTPSERVSASISLDWTQQDFESYYFSSDRRRYEIGLNSANTLNFLIRDSSAYKIDTWSLSLNGDWQATDRLKLNAGYTYSLSEGDVASGLIASELDGTIDGRIDNTLHSFILGANFSLKKNTTLRAGYMYENYDDAVYDDLSGGVHTLMAGVSFTL